jgi:flagellar protein FliL
MRPKRERFMIEGDMADTAEIDGPVETARPKRGLKGLMFGMLGGLVLGGAGFYAMYSGMIDIDGLLKGGEAAKPAEGAVLPDIGFVKMEPIVVSLPPGASARHLRFIGQLEVVPEHMAEVVQLMPRIMDVLNTYLRAVEIADLEQPASISRLRAQMLRRIQVVTGEGKVRDLLISEFILN